MKLKSLVLLTISVLPLSACDNAPDIQVHDYVIGGYEGAAGGAIACTEVHTLFTSIAPAHFSLSQCLQRLIGKVYLEGAALNEITTNVDIMCTSLGSCTYEQQQAMELVKSALRQAQRVNPRRDQRP